MTTKLNLTGTFDHYDISQHDYIKNGTKKTYVNPKIVLTNVTDTKTDKQYGTIALNYTDGFRKFGIITNNITFNFNAHLTNEKTINHPSNIVKIDDSYQPIPDVNDALIVGMIMDHNQKIGRTKTPTDPTLLELFKQWQHYQQQQN